MVYKLNNTFTDGHCTCKKENNELVIIQNSVEERIPFPAELEYYFTVVNKIAGVINNQELKPAPFIHLHRHSKYSLLDGMIDDNVMAKTISEDDHYSPIVAITDHGNISGAYAFNNYMINNGNIPIIGCEVYMEFSGKKNNHLILLCKNEQGYKNLCKILTEAEENFYRHPNVTLDMLRNCSEGLVAMSACLAGALARELSADNEDHAREFIEEMLDIFGEDFYIEIQDHGLIDEVSIRPKLFDLAKEYNIKTIATVDAHYMYKTDSYAHEVLLCVGTGQKITDPTHWKFEGTGYHLLDNKEAYTLFGSHPETIENQIEIVEKCAFRFSKQKVTMPEFEVPSEFTETEYFEYLCKKGFKERFDGTDIDVKAYTERLNYEISVIEQMKFEGYFLIVQDFINYAKSIDIAIGPGRGSCVGSLVAYCLKITDLDPIPLNLLFERFLNPERISMPDIDVDIADDRRQEVIDYVTRKYGADHVSRIITFGTLAARMCIRDVGRAMDVDAMLIDKIAKAIPAEPKMTIEKAMKGELGIIYNNSKDAQKVIDISKKLEGTTRHRSQHACGVIISRDPIVESVPEVNLQDINGNVAKTACFNMVELEDLGLLKMDFLGLRNMSIIKNSVNTIGITEKEINLYDPAVYEFIGSGNTDGIFQIESDGMKKLMKDIFSDIKRRRSECKTSDDERKLGFECFERLIAAISLYRPGPMDYIPDYIAGMRNPKAIHYDTPELEEILSNTYGVLVYQEQVQQICRKLAGYSLGRSDLIRRAMGKKKQSVMDAEKEIFLNGNADAVAAGKEKVLVPGCIANGISPEAANIIWNKMAKFAEYAFNKSHSAGYSVISCQTAWLKFYYPEIFWVETFNSVISKADKVKKYIDSASSAGIHVLSPDINKSEENFSADENGIRMGLKALRNLGAASEPILRERKANGNFKSLEDFIIRVLPDKKVLESLTFSGALDTFGFTRNSIMNSEEMIFNYKTNITKYDSWDDIKEINDWYNSFFNINIENVDEMDKSMKLELEYKYTGMYVSEHPLDVYLKAIDGIGSTPISELVPSDESEDGEVNDYVEKDVIIVGLIKDLQKKITKKGSVMYISKIEDKSSSIRLTIFPKIASAYEDLIDENKIVIVMGTWKIDDFGPQIVANKITTFDNIQFDTDRTLFLLTDNFDENEQIINSLKYSQVGNEVCFRTTVGDKRVTSFYSISKKEFVPRTSTRTFGNSDNFKSNLTFSEFLKLKEKVKDIAFQKV